MKKDIVSWEEAVNWLRSQESLQELVRACYYDDPVIDAASRYLNSSEWAEIRRILATYKKGKALDIGAGRGISSYALTKEGWQVTALEPDQSSLVGAEAIRSLFKDENLEITVVEAMGERLPLETCSFDLVFARQVLHHAADIKAFCQEIARVLRPGGCFMAVREHVISNKKDLDKFLDDHPLHKLYGGENAYLLKEYLMAIKSAGIRLEYILNPYASNINLYPETKEELMRKLCKKLLLPDHVMLPDVLLNCIGSLVSTPGRLYSFIGKKI